MRIPATLFQHLDDCVPEFRGLPERDRWSLAQMLWMFTIPAMRHRRYPGGLSLSKKLVERIWGTGERMRTVAGYRYFKVLKGSNLVRGHTNAFFPVADVAEALRRCMVDTSPERWIGEGGRALRKFPPAISSLANGGKKHSIWKGLTPANSARIDTASLERLYGDLAAECSGLDPIGSQQDADLLTYLQHRLVAISGLLKLARNTISPGVVPVNYTQSTSGRLSGAGLSLQTVPREVRHAALAGCWDYDISNCHWAFVAHEMREHGKQCLAIDNYLANKHAVRAAIAEGAQIAVEEAKACLAMILYGAPATTYEEGAISDVIGVPAARRLYAQPLFKAIHRDVIRARSVLVGKAQALRIGWINSTLGLAIPSSSRPREVLAHLLQGMEAKALMAIVRRYGERIQLCVHDGWVSREPLVVADLQDVIYEDTGYRVDIEAKELSSDLISGIKSVIRQKFKRNQQLTSSDAAECPSNTPRGAWVASGPSAAELADAVARDLAPLGGLVAHNRPDWNLPPSRLASLPVQPG